MNMVRRTVTAYRKYPRAGAREAPAFLDLMLVATSECACVEHQ
jgi:hypothetical protein